jgi:hypothetical protein
MAAYGLFSQANACVTIYVVAASPFFPSIQHKGLERQKKAAHLSVFCQGVATIVLKHWLDRLRSHSDVFQTYCSSHETHLKHHVFFSPITLVFLGEEGGRGEEREEKKAVF